MVKIRAFLAPKCTKIVYHDVFWLHTLYVFGSSQFQKLLFSNLVKMAHFWLNRTCSVGGFTMCPTLPNKILQDLSSKRLPPKKGPWHRRYDVLRRGSKGRFCQKKCIFRAEKGIFSKNSFYTKMFSDPKYSFSVCQKYFFAGSKKNNIFHHS